jgi:hypothetical protein
MITNRSNRTDDDVSFRELVLDVNYFSCIKLSTFDRVGNFQIVDACVK